MAGINLPVADIKDNMDDDRNNSKRLKTDSAEAPIVKLLQTRVYNSGMDADITELLKPSGEKVTFTTSVNNHGIPEYLARSFGDQTVSDITIYVQKRKFYLHKLVLMQSDVFAVMFNNSWMESVKQEITLQEAELCAPHMEEFFKYFYGVMIDINYKNVLALAILADKYHLTSLATACEDSFTNCLLQLSLKRLPPILHFTTIMNLQKLSGMCTRLIALNMSYFEDNNIDSWTFTGSELIDLLTHPDLVIFHGYLYVTMSLVWAKIMEAKNKNWAKKMEAKNKHSHVYSLNDLDVFFKCLIESLDFRTLSPEDIVFFQNKCSWANSFRPTPMLALEKAKIKALQYHVHDFYERQECGIGNVSVLELDDELSVTYTLDPKISSMTYVPFFAMKSEESYSKTRTIVPQNSSSRADKDNQEWKEPVPLSQWSISFVKEKNKKVCVRATLNSELDCERLVRMSVLILADKPPDYKELYAIDMVHVDMVTEDQTSFQIKLDDKYSSGENHSATVELPEGRTSGLYIRVYIRYFHHHDKKHKVL